MRNSLANVFQACILAAVLAVLSLVLAGCRAEAAPGGGDRPTSNPAVSVDVLFEVDGYRVYRFSDGGERHYFVTPQGTVASQHTEHCGKGCTRTEVESIETLGAR